MLCQGIFHIEHPFALCTSSLSHVINVSMPSQCDYVHNNHTYFVCQLAPPLHHYHHCHCHVHLLMKYQNNA